MGQVCTVWWWPRFRCPMLCMRSTRTMGSFRVDIPEEALTTLELDFYELQQLMGVSLATEYVRCHDSIVRQDYWVPPFRDPLYGIVRGGWHSSRAWRVQYWFGQFPQAHTITPRHRHQCHRATRWQPQHPFQHRHHRQTRTRPPRRLLHPPLTSTPPCPLIFLLSSGAIPVAVGANSPADGHPLPIAAGVPDHCRSSILLTTN